MYYSTWLRSKCINQSSGKIWFLDFKSFRSTSVLFVLYEILYIFIWFWIHFFIFSLFLCIGADAIHFVVVPYPVESAIPSDKRSWRFTPTYYSHSFETFKVKCFHSFFLLLGNATAMIVTIVFIKFFFPKVLFR